MICQWYHFCPLRRFENEGKLDLGWARRYCQSETNWKNCQRYRLEAAGIAHPDTMLPDGEIDNSLNTGQR
jgi:hypothetical protein